MRRTLLALVILTALAAAPAASASENLTHVKNLAFAPANGGAPNGGTDIEFATLNGHEYALAGTYNNGLQIVDITSPDDASIAAVYDCGVTQGDVQVFRQDDLPGRTFATYTSDTFGDGTSACYRDAAALGFDVVKPDGSGRNGTFIVELTDPLTPRTVSFLEVPQGSHNQPVHPSGNYLYNSNSDLITSIEPAIEVFDISEPAAPRLAGELALPARPGLGTESHDISFNTEGTRAYSAALSQGVIIDTTDPANPSVIKSFLDPAINVWHQAEPFRSGDREFLIVEDEFAGALGTGQCPNGGVHVYDITGERELDPVKVGYWNIDTVGTTTDAPDGRCTAHVFDIHEAEQLMTIAYYNGGVRVVDLSGLEGISLGGVQLAGAGMREVAAFRFPDGDTWAAKTPRIDANGDFHLYGNDQRRGLDVYRYTAAATPPARKGRWLTPAEALALPRGPLAGYRLACLI
jgi:hypothetical protein